MRNFSGVSIRVSYQDEGVFVALLGHIALVVDEVVDRARLGGIGASEVSEVEAFLLQLLTAGKALAVGVELNQDVVVAGQDAVDLSHHIDLLVGLFIVVAVAARIAAEFLVDTADERLATVEAFSLFFFHIIQLFSYSVNTGC